MKIPLSILIFFICILVGCSNPIENKSIPTQQPPKFKLDAFLDNYIDSNKNWNQNDIIRERNNNKFKTILETKLKEGLLDDIPVKLVEIKEYSKGLYAAHFDDYSLIGAIENKDIHFDIIGLVDEKTISILVENKFYFVKGKFKQFLYKDFVNYIDGNAYTWRTSLESKGGLGIEVNLGILLMDVEQVTPVPETT